MQQGYYYYVAYTYQYGGSWYGQYNAGASCVTTIIPAATISNSSTQKTNIIFTYSTTVGNLQLWMYYPNTTWTQIASTGIPFTKSGNQITVSQLVPGYTYYFQVKTLHEDGYNWTSLLTYTTQSWPTVPSAVSLASRAEGGLYLNWGDHGYEGYGFSYSITDGALYYRSSDNNNWWWRKDPATYGTGYNFSVAPLYHGYYNSNGYEWYAGSYTTPTNLATAPQTPNSITIGTVTTSSIQVTTSVSHQNWDRVKWFWRVRNSGSGYTDSGLQSGLTYTIPSLSSNTYYEILCASYYSGFSLYSVSSSSVFQITSTAQQTLSTPSFTNTNTGYSFISYSLGNISGAQTYYCELWNGATYISTNTGQSGSFTDLINWTTYTLKQYCTGSGYYDSSHGQNFVTTVVLPTPSSPSNVSFTRDPNDTTKVNCSWTKGANTTSMDIAISSDGSTWTVSWPTQIYDSYQLSTGTSDPRYFRIRPHNYYDANNERIGNWTAGSYVDVIDVSRPADFAWTTNIAFGEDIADQNLSTKTLYPIKASEWNALHTRVNLFRNYKELADYSFTTVSAEQTITTALLNEVTTAINVMSPQITCPTATTASDALSTSFWNNFKNSLNSLL